MAENIFHFGKFKGSRLSSVPLKYLEWVLRTVEDKRAVAAAEQEISRRAARFLATHAPKKRRKKSRAGKKRASRMLKKYASVSVQCKDRNSHS